MDEILVNCAVAGPYRHLFTYKLRSEDAAGLEPGCRFLVPFGAGAKIAFFVEGAVGPITYRLRYARERIDSHSPFPPSLFRLCHWMADYYFAGLGEVLAAALPGAGTMRPRLEYVACDHPSLEEIATLSTAAGGVARRFLRGGNISEAVLKRDPVLQPYIRQWLAKGIIATRYKTTVERKKLLGYRLPETPAANDLEAIPETIRTLEAGIVYSGDEMASTFGLTPAKLARLCKKCFLEKVYDDSGISDLTGHRIRHELPQLKLMPEQQVALDEISAAINENRFAPFLLFGVTGSGKTLVYCHAAREAAARGKSILVMVPEIALSGLLLASFAAFFGQEVAVIHSGLTAAQRMAVRERIASGEVKVIIGPRSALFAPINNLGLIVVDEEHDPSYKQDDPSPRYHARDAAVMLARIAACPVILGSASPSIESFRNAETGRYRLLSLPQRPQSGYKMPQIITLDMKSEKISGDCSFLSFRLKKETQTHIAAGGQVIYYLNRRGFSPRLKCRDCGEVPACPDCGVTLAYHRSGNQLKCHFCDRVEPAPDKCSHCGGADFVYLGAGTQRVEENLTRLFENIRAERIDSDKTARKSGRLILSEFAEDKFDLLVGTQMVTKGLDIPNVTLVGVLAADIGLEMPDFRAAEKTYARLLQVAGRAGRGDREGIVMIQTYYSDQPVIRLLAQGNYCDFYEMVLAERRELYYPPFSRLINITLTSEDEKLLEKESLAFRIRLEEHLSGLSTPGAPPLGVGRKSGVGAPPLGVGRKSGVGAPPFAVGKDTGGPPFRVGAESSQGVGSGAPPLGVGMGAPPLAVGKDVPGAPPLAVGPRFVLLGPAPAPMYKLRGQFRRRLIIKCASTAKITTRFRDWEASAKNFDLPAKIRVIFDIDPVNMM